VKLLQSNMVYGGAACGKKVMTSSSSPGISLKQEGISYIAGAELPCLIVNVVREDLVLVPYSQHNQIIFSQQRAEDMEIIT